MSDLQRSLNSSSTAKTRATYEKWAATYDEDIGREGYVAPEIASEYLFKCFEKSSLADIGILDAGCGSGLVGQRLVEHGATQIDGIDLSPAMLDVARRAGVYRSLTIADLSQKLEIPSDTYEAAICVGTLTAGHVGHEAIDELVRVTKPNGFLVLTVRDSVWRENGYEAKVKALIERSDVKLAIDDFEKRRIAKDVDLIYVVLQVI